MYTFEWFGKVSFALCQIETKFSKYTYDFRAHLRIQSFWLSQCNVDNNLKIKIRFVKTLPRIIELRLHKKTITNQKVILFRMACFFLCCAMLWARCIFSCITHRILSRNEWRSNSKKKGKKYQQHRRQQSAQFPSDRTSTLVMSVLKAIVVDCCSNKSKSELIDLWTEPNVIVLGTLVKLWAELYAVCMRTNETSDSQCESHVFLSSQCLRSSLCLGGVCVCVCDYQLRIMHERWSGWRVRRTFTS